MIQTLRKQKQSWKKSLHNDEDTKDDQGMVVFVDELGESAVVMGLRVWVATEKVLACQVAVLM